MKTHLRICLLLALTAYIAAPVYTFGNRRQTAVPMQAGEVAAVRSAFEKLVRAFNAKDAQAVMTFFAEDIILSYAKLPDANYQTNKERFRQAFVPRPGITETFSAEIEEIQVSGESFKQSPHQGGWPLAGDFIPRFWG